MNAYSGPQLRRLREKAGLFQRAIASRAGVSVNTIMRFEQGGACRNKGMAIRAAYADALNPRPKQTGHALRGVRPGAINPADASAVWNGRFDKSWLRSQISAWIRDGVTRAELRVGDTASAPAVLYMASEAQLIDLGRRLGVAMTGKTLQE